MGRARSLDFTAEERWALQRFVGKVDYLNASALAKADIKIRCTPVPGVTHLRPEAWKIELDGADETSVKAAVADFRQLYTDSNGTSAMAVADILQRSALERDTDAGLEIIANLRRFRKALQQRRRVDPRGTILEESPSGGTVTLDAHANICS